MRRLALFLLLVGAWITRAEDEGTPTPTPPIDLKILFKVSIAGKKQEFHIGEIVPLELSFSSHIKNRYQLNEATYDRSGRMDYETFTIRPADGAVDPLYAYFHSGTVFMGGGLTNFRLLTSKPWTLEVNLNEWIRFTKAGDYQLQVSSNRVGRANATSRYATDDVTAISNAIHIKVLPRDETWEKQVLDKAVATLKTAPSEDREENDTPAHKALETLRFLGTLEATRELVKQLGLGPEASSTCVFGIISSPEKTVARQALDQALLDPDYPIRGNFISTLFTLEESDKQEQGKENESGLWKKIVAALPNKRGDAWRVSLNATLDHAWSNSRPVLPEETMRQLTSELLGMFDQLPLEQQATLISWRWDEFKSPDLVPFVKRLAQRDFSNAAPKDGANVQWLAARSLRHWFELDPAGARPFIIEQIKRPKPWFSAELLAMLPDKTLPELDQVLADQYPTPLIARYATGAVLPQVLEKFDHENHEDDCGVDILAYILRVNPDAAKPRIERTIEARRRAAARPPTGSIGSCTRNTLSEIAKIYYDPLLEKIAIATLDSPDPATAADAATMLGEFGSPAAEEVLLRRYERWNKRWAGHESELNLAYLKESDSAKGAEVTLGRSLFDALATGRAWIADATKLKRLGELAKIGIVANGLDKYLDEWNEKPLTLVLWSCVPRFDAHLSQYKFDTIDSLKAKLGEFPTGTELRIELPSNESDRQCVAEIRDFLTSHGMSVIERKPGD